MTTARQQRKNRLHLADMLEHRITDDQFNMGKWTNHCGTVGCALGIAVMSGEFGYGWHPETPHTFSSFPVKDGKKVGWGDAGIDAFGEYAMDNVFWVPYPRSRQDVAAELRAIK